MTANAQIRSVIERIIRLKEEQDALGEDIKEIYAEAKSNGFDKTALGRVVNHVRKRAKKGDAEMDEADAIFDLYLSAYEGQPSHAHTHAREGMTPEDRAQRAKVRLSESMDDNKALSAQMAADGLISPEAHAENIRLSDAVARKLGAGVVDDDMAIPAFMRRTA